MACEVDRSPFRELTSSLEDGWLKSTENGDNHELNTLADFNANFNSNTVESATIDPQMLSNPSSPAASYTEGFHSNSVDHTLSPEPSYPADFTTTQAPYYHSSIEESNTTCGAPVFASTNLRHSFRRSVSEPPDGMHIPPHIQQHRYMPSGPQMTFHRDGHFLGNPKYPGAKRLKSLPKSKQMRGGQPYKTKMAPPPPSQIHHRYQLRRTQTQPVRGPPTSAPVMPTMGTPFMPQPHPFPQAIGSSVQSPIHVSPHQQVFEPLPAVPEQQGFISSRVCTPTPEEMHSPAPAPMMVNPQPHIDPLLTTPASSATASCEQAPAVTVPLTVEQLRGMIVEAVQKAVENLAGPKLGVVSSIEKRDDNQKQEVAAEAASPEASTNEQADSAKVDVKEVKEEDKAVEDDEFAQRTITSEELDEYFS